MHKKFLQFLADKQVDRGTRSAFVRDNGSTDNMRGIRIRHTVTINIVDHVATIYLTVYGLSEVELLNVKYPVGVLVMMVEGLSYGGGQDCNNMREGYVIFMRSTNRKDPNISMDEVNHQTYRSICHLPFLNIIRKKTTRCHGRRGWL